MIARRWHNAHSAHDFTFPPFPQPARAGSSRGALTAHGEQQALALLEEGLWVANLAKEDLIGRVTPSSPAKEPQQGPH